jgi:hypothetical protein
MLSPSARGSVAILQVARFVALAALLVAADAAQADECRRWFQRTVIGPSPSPRGEYGLAYDSDRACSVLFGGAANLSFTAVNKELWEWDGEGWEQSAFTGGPVQRCDHVQAYDAARGLLVIFGGFNGALLADTWEWDGAAWTSRPAAPGARADSFMVYDSVRDTMVMFGGLAAGGGLWGDTWHRTGTTWALQTPAPSPSARWIQRMAFDSVRGVTVLHGGVNGSLFDDTWEWNGTTWTDRGRGGPGARYGHAMAYDSERGVVVLFGGQRGFAFGTGLLADTWEWDGTSWTELAVPAPPARSFVKMVYDSARQRLVLFGGFTSLGFASDTWEFGVYADCDQSTGAGLLDIFDFLCFQNRYTAGHPYACDCDRTTGGGTCDVFDFLCFQNAFAAGCP